MIFRKLLLAFGLNLAIALGFYCDNLDAGITEISSDLANIIPVCMKMDNPDLFVGDMYLNNTQDVKYYIPFYVEILRFLAYCNGGDYLQGLNALGFLTHVCYGFFWFLLFFRLGKNFWLALLFSVFFRGIIWPPGGELLGISGLWTIMPRTLFMALIPLPYLIYAAHWKFRLPLAALVLGIVFNFHPISGVGAIVVYGSLFVCDQWILQESRRGFLSRFLAVLLCCILGMLPYLLTYFLRVQTQPHSNQLLFELAFGQRIGKLFFDPIVFIQSWHRPILYFFSFFFITYLILDRSEFRKKSKLLAVAVIVVFITANASVYIEDFINDTFGKNLKMSFQLIRYQKMLLVLMQIGMFLLLLEMVSRFRIKEKTLAIICISYFALLSVSSVQLLNKVPFLGDDLTTGILPWSLKVNPEPKDKGKKEEEAMISYIRQYTPDNAVFYGTHLLRSGAARAVQLDDKGAAMLIEGSQQKLIKWYQDTQKLQTLRKPEVFKFLRSLGVTHIMGDKPQESLQLEKQIGRYYLYKL